MKVAIVTITTGTNYGNRLQNYALQKVLQNIDVEVETLKNKSGQEKNINIKKKIKILLSKIKNNIKTRKYHKIRREKFKEFNKKYIKFSNIIIDNNYKDKDINNLYDYFICGSDQIWNPSFRENADANFLQFTTKEKRIAYAPSFGVTEISEERKSEYKKYIQGFSKLSVRENEGANIIKNLTNKEAEVLVDPTLLLDKNEWKQISEIPKNEPKGRFLLLYFLGNISEERTIKIQQFAKEFKLIIVNLNKKEYYTSGPSEFLWYIQNAEVIFTDSFHACVFSIIFNKPFIVYNREGNGINMHSRIETLLKKFKLENRYYKGEISEDLLKIDYTQVKEKIEKEKEKSYNFLKDALDIKEN